jgi:uncharacterized protein (TIGR03663 family)
MDNRRFSARAEYGSVERPAYGRATIPFLDRAVEIGKLNWEVIAFVGLMVIAALTRLWDLGPRALHHDESIHAYFSNYYLRTGNYTNPGGPGLGGYDPTYHGPFLYHVTALAFWLLGTSDAITRIMPAFFGIILVGLCWLLRPFTGRLAALIAALLVVLSPSISYYSRSLRHDIFALTGTFMLFLGILWFVRTHQPKWVYLGAVGLAISYSSHELTYIILFIFVVFLVLAALLYNVVGDRLRFSRRDIEEAINPVRSALDSLLIQRWTLIGAVLVFLAIYVVLYTNLLTKPNLILTGFYKGLEYWLGQHGEARGNQPSFYYTMLMFIYEPLAFIAGLGTLGYIVVKWLRADGDIAPTEDQHEFEQVRTTDEYGVALPSIETMRGFTISFVAFWSVAAFIGFSIAGEKMPWLNMQVAFPFSLLAAMGLAKLLTTVEWQQVWRAGGALLGVVTVLFLFSAFVLRAHLSGEMPAPMGTSTQLQLGMRGVLLFLIAVGLLALASWLAYRILPGRAVKVVALTLAILLLGYGIRSMMLVNYRHGDVPVEMLVYTQSAPDVPIVADMVKRLSRDVTAFDARNAADVTGGNSLPIGLDQTDAIEWPFDWYFRDMRQIQYFNEQQWQAGTPPNVPPNIPVLIVSEATNNNQNFQNFVKDKYVSQKYVLNWWFPEEAYKKNNEQGQFVGDIPTAWNWLIGNGMKYLLYRNPGLPLGSRNFYLYVRNDLAPKTGLAAPSGVTTGGTAQGPSPDGPVYKMTDLAPAGVERGQFNLPRGMAVGPDGSFYVVDTANMRIQKFDASGNFVAIIGNGKGNGDGQFLPFSDEAVGTGPGGIAVDKQGNIYVADTWNHRIQKFDANGRFLLKWGEFINFGDPNAANDPNRNNKFFGPRGVAIGPDGNVYVTDTGNKRVVVFDPTGKYLRQIDSGMDAAKVQANYVFNKPGEMNEPIGIVVDNAGNVYVADTNNQRIQKFDPQGKFVAQWPVPAPNWSPGPYLEPFLAIDGEGNIYATAPTGRKVLKFSPTGQLLGEKSSEGAVNLTTPTGIAVTQDGTVYVVDTGAHGVVNLGKIP